MIGIILAGGLGTRLKSVDSNVAKPMVQVGGKPFLYWLLRHLVQSGITEAIISVGHKAKTVTDYDWAKDLQKLKVSFEEEEKPLGTGGAIKHVFEKNPHVQLAWVINGDTLVPTKLPKIENLKFEAIYTVLADNQKIYDAIPNIIIKEGLVVGVGDLGTAFDAGQVYITREAVMRFSGAPPYSCHQLLEPAIKDKKVGAISLEGQCYDIGTPERLKRFEEYLKTFKTKLT